ncbi:hypothetical protein G9U51_08275 [Calidifontibacter sp. DB0510]|uniref:Uncharacterized protein n=1 Tax=Metallococcus carri TaxID=1656884 RepID=A0A967EEL0_9MICO|nr:hypothetical protein [Metallococcus carri]NHN55771.1 hypothetical protein [Metallococcus carri]NOP38540.1 hypothetical protein [Calidifontibacter sp. DB2511S]
MANKTNRTPAPVPDNAPRPTDHQAKQTGQENDDFTFTGADGNTYTIPDATEAMRKVPGSAIHEMMLNPSDIQMQSRLTAFALEQSNIEPVAKAQLLALPWEEYVAIVGDWFESADVEGASVGKSSGSSD